MKTQKSLAILAALLVLLGIQLSLALSTSSANDNPHNQNNTISCANCHDATSAATYPNWWTDQETYVCGQCHQASATHVYTHRDLNGNVLVQCTQCHDPHSQLQDRTWRTTDIFYQFSGVSSAVTTSTLQMTGAGWTANQWIQANGKGYLLMPDIRYPAFIYRIAGNTVDTITISTNGGDAINTTYCKPGATFAIVLGKLVKDTVNNSAVKFFRETGTNSFVDTTGTIDGICQVCHTTTSYFNTQGVLDAGGTGSHPLVIGTSQKCTDCHNHTGGFKPACNQCHGYPPVDASTLITKDMNGNPVTSNSPGPGAHNDHVTSAGFTCANCHTGGMLGGASQGDNKINIGFMLNGSNLTGTYDTTVTGQTRSVFPVVGAATTTVTYGGTLQCSNLYCHDPGNIGNKSPIWTGSLPDRAECDSCHGGNSTSSASNGGVGPMSTGKHPQHMNNLAFNAYFACGRCHAATVTTGDDRTITGPTKHVNGVKDVVFDSLNPGATANPCSNLYCHSNGKGVYTSMTYSDWYNSAKTLGCNGCHGTSGTTGAPDYPTTGGGTANANSHGVAAHVSSSADCIKCHTNTTTTGSSITGTLHINGSIDVTIGSSYSIGGASTGHYNVGTKTKTCTNVTCHGSQSPQWGTDLTGAGIATCTKCHGLQTMATSYTLTDAAPGAGGTGVDTAGNSSNTSPKVGAHEAHLEALHGYTLPVNCNECHTVPNAFSDAGHISSDGTASVPLGGTLATTNTRSVPGVPTFNPATEQCSNVYCHDSSRFKNGWSNVTGTVPQPVWNSPMLAGGGVPGDCGKCHGYPPDTSSGKHPNSTACHTCHQHVNSTDNGFLPANTPITGGIEKHMDGQVEGGGCDNCHGNPPVSAAYTPTAPSTGLIGTGLGSGDTGATNPITPGAHDYHTNADPTKGLHMTCDACHAGYSTMGDHNLKFGFKVDSTTFPGFVGSASTGTFTGYAGLSNGYTFSNAGLVSTAILTTASYANANTCAVYCHGRGAPGKPALTGGTVASGPTWSDNTTAACGSCHGASSSNPPTTGKHQKHAGTYGFACATCHASTPADGTHVNGSVAWQFNTGDPRLTTSSTYSGANSGSTGALAPSASYGACSNIYCHSNGTSTTIFTPNVTTYTWTTGTTLPANCTGCHNGNATTASPMISNKHSQHINNASMVGRTLACGNCHNATVASSNDQAITNFTNHANMSVNIKFDNSTAITLDSDNPTYSGQSTTGANGAALPPSATGAACSNVYCHSSGNVNNAGVAAAPVTYMTVTWDSASPSLNCGGCHGNSTHAHPVYASGPAGSQTANSHVTHVENNGYSCDYCHVSTTTDTKTFPALPTSVVAGGTHLNRSDDVSFKVNGGKTGAYNASLKSCSATYCHGSGASPQWGSGLGSITCASCHQSQGASGTVSYSGTHQKHVGTYNFSCEMCHAVAGTTHAGGPAGTNQTAEVKFTNLGPSGWVTGQSYRGSTTLYSYRTLTVNPYGVVTAPSPTYVAGTTVSTDTTNTTITFTNGSCSTVWCHSNANPVNGVNSYATPSWGTGLTCGSCHRTADTTANMTASGATGTMSAPHVKHVASDAYGKNPNFTCEACHAGTAQSDTALITGSTGSHVNGQKDVIFDTTWVASNGTYTSGVGCTNIYCHSNGTKLTAPFVTTGTPSWQTPLPNGCASCHGSGTTNGMPNYTSGGANKANSHVAHVTTEGYTCYDCHSNTVDSTSSAISVTTGYTSHVNQKYDVAGAKISLYTQGTNTGGTCTNTCHGTSTTTVQWGKNYSGYDACTKCHGTLTAGATDSVLTNVTGSAYPWSPNAYLSAPSPTANPSGLFTDLSSTRVGVHQQHLTTNPYRGPIACAECHQVPATPNTAGHMIGLPATVSFKPALSSYLANTYQGANIPNATYANGTCSNVYCHNGTYFKNGWSSGQTGTVPSPVWSNTTMLSQTNPTATDCGICHGYPPGGGHEQGNNSCNQCHSHVASNNLGFSDISKHMDGIVEGGGCNGCHWYGTNDPNAWTVSQGTSTLLINTQVAWGAHIKHINYLASLNSVTTNPASDTYGSTGTFPLICGVCHDQNATTVNHQNSAYRHIDFNNSTLHQFGSSPTLTYNFNTITQTGTRSCSNVDCHYKTTPVW